MLSTPNRSLRWTRGGARWAPRLVLLVLSSAWGLVGWGGDESLAGLLATHLPAGLYVAFALVALLGFACAPSSASALAAVLSLLLALVPLGGFTLPTASSPAQAPHRVLTYNVEQWSHGGDRVAAVIARAAPDVFCLQEAGRYEGPDPDSDWSVLREALPGYQLVRQGEVVIGTRWPVQGERRIALPVGPRSRPLLEVMLQTPEGGLLRVLTAHLVYAGYYGRRPAALALSARGRRAQAERILEHLRAGPELPTILCGDLNAPPNSAVLSALRTRLEDAWRLRGHGFGMTTSASWPVRRIDYLLVGGVHIGEIEVNPERASDHRALCATFSL